MVAVGGSRWPVEWPKTALLDSHTQQAKQEHKGYLGPPWGFLVADGGGGDEADVGEGSWWWWVAEQVAKTT